jgi:hypothetical protein
MSQSIQLPASRSFWHPMKLWKVIGIFAALQVTVHALAAIAEVATGMNTHVGASAAASFLGVVFVGGLARRRRGE